MTTARALNIEFLYLNKPRFSDHLMFFCLRHYKIVFHEQAQATINSRESFFL